MADLVISDQRSRESYIVTALETVFQLPFQFFEDTDVEVFYKADGTTPDPVSDKLPGSSYVVTGANVSFSEPRYITLQFTPPNGAAVIVNRNIPEDQQVDYTVGGTITPNTLDFVNNKLTMLIQQVSTQLEKTGVLYPVTADLDTGQTSLPVLGANEYWQANALGNLQAVTIAENADWSTLRSQLLSQLIGGPGTDLIGYYDTVLSIGTSLTSFLNTLNVEYNLIKDGIPSTGFASLFIGGLSDVKTGWIMMDDGTIGNAISAATTRANADTKDLFELIWNNVIDTWAPVSGGRGASAQADYDNNKTITLTRQLGRSLCISGTGATLSARVQGSYLGEEDHMLSEGEVASHTHPTGALFVTNSGAGGSSGSFPEQKTPKPWADISDVNVGDLPHNNMQPSAFWNVIIKL